MRSSDDFGSKNTGPSFAAMPRPARLPVTSNCTRPSEMRCKGWSKDVAEVLYLLMAWRRYAGTRSRICMRQMLVKKGGGPRWKLWNTKGSFWNFRACSFFLVRSTSSKADGNIADRHARLHRLGDNGELLIHREPPPAGDAGDHFNL